MTTAKELMDELNADPEWVRAKKEKEDAINKRWAICKVEEAKILPELRAVGVVVDSTWDLVNTRQPYPAAIPILMKHLQDESLTERSREGLARALICKESQGVADNVLLTLFYKTDAAEFSELKWVLGYAVSIVCKLSIEEIDAILVNHMHGRGRLQMVNMLKRRHKSVYREHIMDLLAKPIDNELREYLQGQVKNIRKKNPK